MTQLNAIIGSCLKWWRIRYQGGVDKLAVNCPLCKRVENKRGVIMCSRCPVFAKTKERSCEGTPYSEWSHKATCDKKGHYAHKGKLTARLWSFYELQFLFDLIKPRYYPNVIRELRSEGYPMKFRTWMERAIDRKIEETP